MKLFCEICDRPSLTDNINSAKCRKCGLSYVCDACTATNFCNCKRICRDCAYPCRKCVTCNIAYCNKCLTKCIGCHDLYCHCCSFRHKKGRCCVCNNYCCVRGKPNCCLLCEQFFHCLMKKNDLLRKIFIHNLIIILYSYLSG